MHVVVYPPVSSANSSDVNFVPSSTPHSLVIPGSPTVSSGVCSLRTFAYPVHTDLIPIRDIYQAPSFWLHFGFLTRWIPSPANLNFFGVWPSQTTLKIHNTAMHSYKILFPVSCNLFIPPRGMYLFVVQFWISPSVVIFIVIVRLFHQSAHICVFSGHSFAPPYCHPNSSHHPIQWITVCSCSMLALSHRHSSINSLRFNLFSCSGPWLSVGVIWLVGDSPVVSF